jgi:hypothetical protein
MQKIVIWHRSLYADQIALSLICWKLVGVQHDQRAEDDCLRCPSEHHRPTLSQAVSWTYLKYSTYLKSYVECSYLFSSWIHNTDYRLLEINLAGTTISDRGMAAPYGSCFYFMLKITHFLKFKNAMIFLFEFHSRREHTVPAYDLQIDFETIRQHNR